MPEGTDDRYGVINGTASSGGEGLEALCARLAARVNDLLDAEVPSDILRAVQRQTREGLEVIREALQRYR
jgi:hypothetical protein